MHTLLDSILPRPLAGWLCLCLGPAGVFAQLATPSTVLKISHRSAEGKGSKAEDLTVRHKFAGGLDVQFGLDF